MTTSTSNHRNPGQAVITSAVHSGSWRGWMNRLNSGKLLTALLWLVLAPLAPASEPTIGMVESATPVASDPPPGQVTLPLEAYQRLLHLASTQPLPSPSSYALGQAGLNIVFTQRDRRVSATVTADLEVETFADDWTLVPLLGPGAALESAAVDDQPVQLVQRAEGLFWLAEGRRTARLVLTYHADARFAEKTWIASLPVPQAAASRFQLRIPQTRVDLAVAPSANLVTQDHGTYTSATGTLPASPAVMVSWRVAVEREYVLNRAEYRGVLRVTDTAPINGTPQQGAIAWQARIDAELLVDGEVTVPLVSTATTLSGVEVDGEPATVFDQDGRFAVRIAGAGKHRIDLAFLSAVTAREGVPSSGFDIPDVPVSKFELELPGDKLLQARSSGQLAASVQAAHDNGLTHATFHVPMSRHLQLSWMEAIPADIDVEGRAHAVVYQALHAAEGVLYGLAAIRYEITRGETRQLEFTIPATAQVNQVTSQQGAIADWVVVEPERSAGNGSRNGAGTESGNDAGNVTENLLANGLDRNPTRVRVFLNRAVSGEFILEIAYEQLLDERPDPDDHAVSAEAPIVRALEVTRQKGMLALLAGPDLALAPVEHPEMSEVGENQLPAFFRNRLEQAVSHTFKYHDDLARLAVQAVTPEREPARFNAQVDQLISIGEVTLKGQVGIDHDVKSGALRELELLLPADLEVLGVSGPSIRAHTVSPEDGRQRVAIAFTRDMDGQFRIELNYERIMLDGTEETSVPRVDVVGADVVQGRIAIEALAALEVQPAKVEHLSALEIGELPRQLVLNTTNPILLAYRYARTETPFALNLRITRHEEIDVQVAAIDSAHYQTLYTADGLAVTRVTFEVRNARRQFLRLALPPGSEVWSVFVDGEAEKPAFASDSPDDSTDVLIRMINSTTAFPVELVYATRGEVMDAFGTLQGRLPRPDMIVTRSNWDVYVPADPRYAEPKTNMDVIAGGIVAAMRDTSAELLRGAVTSAARHVVTGEPLHIELPTQGILYRFAKLYANQSPEPARFTLSYVHPAAGFAGLWLSLLATFVIWAGIAKMGSGSFFAPERSATVQVPQKRNLTPFLPWLLITAGTVVLAMSLTLLGASPMPPSVLSVVLATALLVRKVWRSVSKRRYLHVSATIRER